MSVSNVDRLRGDVTRVLVLPVHYRVLIQVFYRLYWGLDFSSLPCNCIIGLVCDWDSGSICQSLGVRRGEMNVFIRAHCHGHTFMTSLVNQSRKSHAWIFFLLAKRSGMWLPHCSYGVYVAITGVWWLLCCIGGCYGSSWQLRGLGGCYGDLYVALTIYIEGCHIHPVGATYIPLMPRRPRSSHR